MSYQGVTKAVANVNDVIAPALIKENLAEVLNEEIIKKILDEGQHPKIYWGT